LFSAYASAFAKDTPTSNAPISPAPLVTAIASISSKVRFASFNAWATTVYMASVCALDAISGTTPPNLTCSVAELIMQSAKISLPPFTIDAAVSSQLVSMPSMTAFSFIAVFLRFQNNSLRFL